ncbi:MAG: PilZ domain-containing protein [Nitrospiraceae bacterium]|nr:MAG: PilZ domain-containing protein [Nitrospiraceae bacterium]
MQLQSKTAEEHDMNKRLFSRIPTGFRARLLYKGAQYEGNVVNVSKYGMHILTGVKVPVSTKAEVILCWQNREFRVPVEVRQQLEADNDKEGIGVEIIHMPDDYREFVDTLYFFYSIV